MTTQLILKLGDIIEINSPNNDLYHEHVFIIDYIDNTSIDLIKINDGTPQSLALENNTFKDESIEQIFLLDRSENDGYIKQNDIEVGQWLNLHFGGDFPAIFTTQVTSIEEDMIELTKYPDLEVIYIDFEYKGIPKNLPLEKIEKRDAPAYVEDKIEKPIKDQEYKEISETPEPELTIEMLEKTPEEEDQEIEIEEENIDKKLGELINESQEIIFGERLHAIKEVVEVDEKEKRYDIEIQVNDLMDELLSTIPNEKRNQYVINNIQLLITRFKELRHHFSEFKNGNVVVAPKLKGPFYKPLVKSIENMNTHLQWLIPIVKTRKHICDFDDDSELNDVVYTSAYETYEQLHNAQQKYYVEKQMVNSDVMDNLVANTFKPYNKPYESNDILMMQDVNTNIEAIIDNIDDFKSSIIDGENLSYKQYVIQKYNLGMKKVTNNVTKQTVLINNTPNEQMAISSFMSLPYSAMRFSKLYMNNEKIMNRVHYHQNFLSKFRLFTKHQDIVENMVDDLDNELDYSSIDILKNVNHYVLSDTNFDNSYKYNKYLESVIPKSKTIINIMRKILNTKYSFVSYVNELEPFMIYNNDLTYTQHNEIRYVIKENIKNLKKNFVEKAALFNSYRNMQSNPNIIKSLLKLLDEDSENMVVDYGLVKVSKDLHNHELLKKMYVIDDCKLLYAMLSKMMFVLNIPKKMDIDEETSNPLKIKSDCGRRYLAKEYENLEELMKDNGKDELFFDESYDDTPYDILSNYETEKRNMVNEDFYDFLVENLTQKHEVSKDSAKDLASVIIRGKREVLDNDYAKVNVTKPSEQEQKYHYYKRMKKNWLRDDSINETIFMDNNTLFCNIKSSCFKNKTNNLCQSKEEVQFKIQQKRENQLLSELEARYVVNMEELESELNKNLESYKRYLNKFLIIKDVNEQKHNNLQYQLGMYANTDVRLKSPHHDLLQKILGTGDFSEKQQHILQFVTLFCRNYIEDSGELPFWKYCKDSNVKLMPAFLYELAYTFSTNGDYASKLQEIIRVQGAISDDGDSIVDKYSGMVISQVSLDSEEGFDESGFKVSTRSLLESEITKMEDQPKLSKKEKRIFENPNMEKVYNIFSFLCKSTDVKEETIDSFCLRLCIELVETQIKSEESYNKLVKKYQEKKDVKMPKYDTYFNETLILIVSSCFLICNQVSIPGIKPKKTFPGCVKSFEGYPLTGDEDYSGLNYVSCVLYKTRNDIEPWSAVKKYNQSKFAKRIKEIIDKYLLVNSEIDYKIKEKKQYLLLHKDDEVVEEHKVEKWTHFMPPLVKFNIQDSVLQNISSDYKKEIITNMKQGRKQQHSMIDNIFSKNLLMNYQLINEVNEVILKESPLLKTHGAIPFIDNACCNNENTKPIAYFSNKNPKVGFYINSIINNEALLKDIKILSKAPLLYHEEITRMVYPSLPIGHLEENIYKAVIHYCNFDKNDQLIPEKFQALSGEIPKSYSNEMTLEEKIIVLKRNGKKYDINTLMQVLNIINNENKIHHTITPEFSFNIALTEFLDYLSSIQSPVIEDPLIRLLNKNIEQFKQNEFKTEETKELDDLKTYLGMINNKLYLHIMDFIEKYGNTDTKQYNIINTYLENINSWNEIGKNHAILCDYLKTLIYNFSKLYPNLLKKENHFKKIGDHWNLSDQHKKDMSNIIDKQYSFITKFTQDESILLLLKEVENQCKDLHIFASLLPVEIFTGKYAFLDSQTTHMLLKYCVYSVLYEYINITDNGDIVHLGVEMKKAGIRQHNKDTNDSSMQIESNQTSITEDIASIQTDLDEVEIISGNTELIKKNVCELLVSFLTYENDNKNKINISYEQVKNKTTRSKEAEKKMIVKYLGRMSIEMRKIEDKQKKYKLGKWNTGMQKGLFKYDKSTYNREREEFIQKMADPSASEQEFAEANAMVQDVLDIERHEEELQDAFYENEATNISHLDEDYNDGVYYEEDREP